MPWHPCLPPLSPLPLPSLLSSPLLTRQPCHHLHCLAALTLLVACHPHCRHSRCRRHCPCCCSPRTLVLLVACHPHCHHSRCRCHCPRCCSPRTLVAIAIALATIASAIIIACHPCCRHNCPLCCLCLHSPTTLVASRHHPACRPTAVVAVAAMAGCQPWRRWRCWQRGDKVNQDNNNNMTTTQQPTQQPTRQPTWGGDN